METSSVDYICAVLRKLGMIEVSIQFSGCGDSGNVDDVLGEGMCDLNKTPVDDFPVVQWRDENGVVQTAAFSHEAGSTPPQFMPPFMPPSVPTSMRGWLIDWFDAHHENFISYDWVNNDGGGGTLVIVPQENRVELDGYYNHMVSEPVTENYEPVGYAIVTEEVTDG